MQLSAGEQAALDAARERDSRLRASPEHRRREGIVHTPPELARFVARAVDQLLHDELGVVRGLADARVHVVDPACGPGAFLAAALQVASQNGAVDAKLTGIDRDAHALELAVATRAASAGVQLELRHADTLRDAQLIAELTDPTRVLCVLGNPPWSVSAADASPGMQQLLEDFRRDAAGERLPEKKLGVLSDAYVRFFRWVAELARRAEAGAVVGLVTNASFLDGPVQRGMRAALLRWFDAVHVVDLGGNALLGRARGATTQDHNVFGVRTGVAVTLLVRRPMLGEPRCAQLSYAKLVGARAHKLDTLATATHAALQPAQLSVQPPSFSFLPVRPRDARYQRFVSLAECMPFHREGVQSNRDAVAVAPDRETLLARLRAFVAGEHGTDPRVSLQASTRLSHYDPALAREHVAEALRRDPEGTRNISARRLAYRPFDERWFCPVTPLCHRPRPELQAAFEQHGFALLAVRKDRGSAPYTHFGATLVPPDNCFLSTRSSCRTRAFPARTPEGADNLAVHVRDAIETRAGLKIDARMFACYALCVIAAPSYRACFDAELRTDYPRIPLPESREQLELRIQAGERLVSLLVAPCVGAPAGATEATPAVHARFSQLQLDDTHGGIRLAGKSVVACEPDALALRIGHHELLRTYLAARGDAVFDARAQRELAARVARAQDIVSALAACEQVARFS